MHINRITKYEKYFVNLGKIQRKNIKQNYEKIKSQISCKRKLNFAAATQ